MTYSSPDSVVVDRIQRAFPPDELRERARATNLVKRERRFDIVALFYKLSLGLTADSNRSLQAFLERYVEMAECDELSYEAFHEWFEPGSVALLRENSRWRLGESQSWQKRPERRLERFRNVLIVDATFISLY